jgi:glutathione S-transferase
MKNAQPHVATLITMRLSHFCEKARWGLDRVGFPYREESHAPLVHRLVTTRNRGSTVPILVCGAETFTDSTAILQFADERRGGGHLYPSNDAEKNEVIAWVERLGNQLGPHARRWVYGNLLTERKLLIKVWSDGIPNIEARLVPFVLPIATRLIRSGYRINPESIARSFDRIVAVFEDVEGQLRGGSKYLVGSRFTAADLTFAALSSPLILPPECRAAMPSIESLPPGMRETILEFRESAAGQFALRMYQQERGVTASDAQPVVAADG